MEEPSEKAFPWGPVVVVLVFVAMGVFAFWITREKKSDAVHAEAIASLDKELGVDEQAVKDERAKLDAMTAKVEELRAKITAGAMKDGKAAVAEFNKLAADQRAEREKFIQMADAYNQKLAKFKQMEQ